MKTFLGFTTGALSGLIIGAFGAGYLFIDDIEKLKKENEELLKTVSDFGIKYAKEGKES